MGAWQKKKEKKNKHRMWSNDYYLLKQTYAQNKRMHKTNY